MRHCVNSDALLTKSPQLGGKMAVSKATRIRARKKAYQRVIKLHKASGKIVAGVELYVSSEYYKIEIRFDDKTALVFDVEPCVQVFSDLADWTTGNYKPIRRWRPVHSRSSRLALSK